VTTEFICIRAPSLRRLNCTCRAFCVGCLRTVGKKSTYLLRGLRTFGCATLFVWILACAETSESYYPSYASAEESGSLKRGWLPAWLPATALDIHEWHDLDSNKTLAAFRFASSERPDQFLSECAATAIPTNPSEISWWPKEAQWKLLAFFRCPERVEFGDGHTEVRDSWAALDKDGYRVYFWR
jgi:hypothetical protein